MRLMLEWIVANTRRIGGGELSFSIFAPYEI